jgi:putative Mg2+ transporter-C (MgtC) family protein
MIPFSDVPEVMLKLAVAVCLGAILGVERERKGRAAGLRTHTLVCLGAALSMILARYLPDVWSGPNGPITFDRGRIAQGVLTGVGFLGAGTIITVSGIQRGLTTAATIWFVAALGLCVGAGLFIVSVCAVVVAFVVIVGFEYVDRRIPANQLFTIEIAAHGGFDRLRELEDFIRRQGFDVRAVKSQFDSDSCRMTSTFAVNVRWRQSIESLLDVLSDQVEGMQHIVFTR